MIENLDIPYIKFDQTNEWNTTWGLLFFKTTCTWVLIFTNFVPISLLVTLELVHFFHAIFMSKDVMMYDTDQDFPLKTASSNIIEELGQVEYVFSDKTGTLTCNVMVFKKFSTEFSSFEITKQEEAAAGTSQQGALPRVNSADSRNGVLEIGFNSGPQVDHRGTGQTGT